MLKFIIGAVVGGLIVWVWMRRKGVMDSRLRGNDRKESGNDKGDSSASPQNDRKAGEKGEIINPEQVEKRQENLQRVLDLFKDHPQVTNEIVTGALGVSDATAVRYFDELEAQGKIEQVGSTGQKVYYKLPPSY